MNTRPTTRRRPQLKLFDGAPGRPGAPHASDWQIGGWPFRVGVWTFAE